MCVYIYIYNFVSLVDCSMLLLNSRKAIFVIYDGTKTDSNIAYLKYTYY